MIEDLRPGFSRWDDPATAGPSRLARVLRFVVIGAIHVAVLAGATLWIRPELATEVERVYVRLIEATPRPEPPPLVEQARPLPMVRQKTVRQPDPLPVLAAPADSSAPASFAVAPAPPAPPVAAPAGPPVVTEASFDAEYLHNPKPDYPWVARRRGDEGKVMLRVRVSAQGNALAVEVSQSSGAAVLDEAARDAVLRWRFVPARRGSEAIESWVGVPIAFRLDR
jgi:periplasmic protein TonB